MLNQQVFKPVNTLNKVVDDIHDGHYKVNVGDLGTDIIQNLGNRITEMAEQISTQIEQLETSNEALQETSEKALKASTAKSLFLSNMSHEIRTPLNAILGTLQLLERDKLTQEQTNLVIRSLYSARTLMTIINDILDYSKIEANELVLEKTEFELQQVVDSIQSDLAATALLKGINLQCHIEQRFNDGWLGDPVRVRQVILNLVSNAVKFTEQGGVTVNISHVSVDQGEGVYVEVIDTGIGMTEEEQQKIGTRFTQADSSTTRKFGGTGLGMAITLNLVNLMGGNLIIESQTGKGTKIGVRLPLEKTDLKLTDISNENVSIPRMEHSRILLAEDNEINQEILQAMLQPSGCRLDIVENGAAAVEALKINDYDLVLMDIQMPVMDGVVAFETIRRFNVQIPIIALTANVMSDDVQRYNDLGFNAYIGKPIDMNLLYSTLDKFVPHCRKRA
jgi:signal transduction histidine kinase/CheY-like chemotaxis protein